MNMNEETYHIINAYLKGELKGRALDKFKIDLKENKDLQEAVATQSSIIQAIEAAREKELKAFISNEVHKTKTIALNPKWRIALASAAAIALIAVAIFTLSPLLQSGSDNTASDIETELLEEKPQEVLEDNLVDTTTITENTTRVDSQTIAQVEPPAIDILEPEAEMVEDYKTDINDMELEEEPLESEDADGVTTEMDKYVNTAKPDAPTPTTANTPVLEKDEDIVVKSDEILGKKSYPVYAAALDLENRSTSLQEVQVVKAEKLSRKEKKAMRDAAEAEEAAPARKTTVRAIKVEYWQSVVNYKGYQYNGVLLKLYGVDQQTNLEFKQLDNRLYVKMGGKQYFLENNQKYNRMAEVTNPTLLKVLNE